MKKRFLSILCVLSLILSLLPATAMAATNSTAPDTIYICGMELTEGKCLTSNDVTSVSDYTDGASYVALYKNGVLHLNGLDKTYAGQANGYRTLNWNYSSSGKHDLVIELAEGSVNTLVDTNYGAINGASGYSSGGPSLTIQGNGILNVTGGTYAIWVWESVTIQNGATVNANGGTQSGISINNTNGAITVKQGTTVTTRGAYGISGSNGHTINFNIEGGNLVVKGTTQALYNTIANIDSAIDVYVSNKADPTQASDVATWNKTANLVSTDLKYISLSGFSSTVTTYDVTTDTTSNGTFEVDYTKSMADETITITANPDDGYELKSVTVTDADNGNVPVSGEGNLRTFIMPAKDVTVSVTFEPTTYEITYNLDGGANAVNNPATYTVETNNILLESPDRSGYTFDGWFDNPELTGSAVTVIAKGSTGNKTLYAKWTQNQTVALEDVTFGYAYDVQRDVKYPSKDVNVTTEKSNNSYPLGADGNHLSAHTGNWMLTKAGTYFYVTSLGNVDSDLTDIVEAFATNYSVDKDAVIVHELKKDGIHIAYGVVVAYDAVGGYALFVGDTWSSASGGAGYLLSVNKITASTKVITATQIATDFVPTRSISLSQTNPYTFASKTSGYATNDLAALTITVTNSGNTDTGALNVSLDGTNASSFTLEDVDADFKAGIAGNGGFDTFTVVPNPNLSASTYTATVTVSGVDIISKSFDVSFTVTAPTTYDVTFAGGEGAIGTAPTQPATAVGSKFNLPNNTFIKDGHTFAGWNDGTNTYAANAEYTMPDQAVTFTAQWSPNTYTVTVTNGTGGGDYAEGTSVTIMAGTAPDGQQFKEWLGVDGLTFTNGSATSATATFTMPANAVAVTATYEDIPVTTYAVTFVGGEGAEGTAPTQDATAEGEKFNLPAADIFTKTGYNFVGWYDGECTYAAGAEYTMPAKAVTFTARWTVEAKELEEMTFGYAYDVQRNPAWPSANSSIRLYSLDEPILSNGTRGTVNAGSWTLTKIGTYSYVKTLGKSIAFVSTVAENYNVSTDEIVIHELKDGSTHIAYGIVILYNAAEGYAGFIGDSLSSGAGYLLSKEARISEVTTTADMVATDFVPTCELVLDPTGTYTFNDASPKTVTASNSGNTATGALSVTLSGANVDSFELSKVAIADIAAGGSDTFTVQPKSGLAAGTYTATVTVSGTNVVAKFFDVAYTINAPSTPVIPVSLLNDGYPYGKDMSGNNVTLVVDVTNADSTTTYQWQACSTKGGAYENVGTTMTGTNTLTLTLPVSGTWYRCVVNGTLTSKAVQVVEPVKTSTGDANGNVWTNSYSYTNYYISNSTVAYMVDGSRFDVVGLYVKDSTSYMIQTSYSKNWQMFSSTQATPAAFDCSDSTPSAALDALRVAFDDIDACAVYFEADLAEGQQAFSFGADTQLGNNTTSGSYADNATLIGTVENNTLKQVAMIGAASEADAKDSDPAFVIAPNAATPVSKFWIGYYGSREAYGSSTDTKIEDRDSGMTMSWLSVTPGGSVNYIFKVGTAEATGAIRGDAISSPTGEVTLELTVEARSIVVKVDGAELIEGTDYIIDMTADSLHPKITFLAAAGLTHESVITVDVTLSGETFPQTIDIINNIPIPTTATVTFVDYNGTVLQSGSVEIGTDADAPDEPTRDGYTFIGWDKDFSNITADLTVTAQYTINTYTVTFVDYDGTQLSATDYAYGTAVSDIVTPVATKADKCDAAGNLVETYTFAGWTPKVADVTSAATYTATYTTIPATYTVKFYDYDGTQLGEDQTVKYGEAAAAPDTPNREGYTFTSWDKDFSDITTDLTVTAQYTINTYTVTFMDGTTQLDQKVTPYNTTITEPKEPVKRGYIFLDWYIDKEYTVVYDFSAPVTRNIVLYAKWVAVYQPPVVITHSCISKCEVCGGCMDATCHYTACEDKCTLLNMNFTDVEDEQWYTNAVEYVFHHEMMQGIGNNLFDIYGTTTRAMIVTILWRLEGCPASDYEMSFEDVAVGTWYTEAVRWAASEGIVNGYSDIAFGPTDSITREQLATILYRYEQHNGGGYTGVWMIHMDYVDLADVSDWAYEAMCWMNMNQIINGKPGNVLAPKGNASRAEAATILYRYCKVTMNEDC